MHKISSAVFAYRQNDNNQIVMNKIILINNKRVFMMLYACIEQCHICASKICQYGD